MSHDFITLVQTSKPCNKIARRGYDGTLRKKSKATISAGIARTVRASDVEALEHWLRWSAEKPNRLIILGFFPGAEPAEGEDIGPEFRVLSARLMRRLLGLDEHGSDDVSGWHEINGKRCICPLKINVLPSAWVLLDRDMVRGMPEALAGLDEEQWLAAMARLLPGFDATQVLREGSTSARILVDGVPLESKGAHYYFRINDPYDLERIGAALLLRSFVQELGFMRPMFAKDDRDKVVGHRPWSIFDPTTFSPERLVFTGAPTVRGEGLSLGPPSIERLPGDRPAAAVDTGLIETPDDDVARKVSGLRAVSETRRRKVRRVTGEVVEIERPVWILVDDTSLRLDTVIEAEGCSPITVRDYWLSDRGKLRVQTPFRESSSWNGILNRFADNVPFCYDNGTRIRYDLNAADVYDFAPDVVIAGLDKLSDPEIIRGWVGAVEYLSPTGQGRVKQWVHKRTKVGLRELGKELTEALKAWAKAKRKRQQDRHRPPHKIAILWDEARLDSIVETVQQVLFSGRDGAERVLSYGRSLCRAVVTVPVTVRQVQKLHELGVLYPAVLLLQAYDIETLRLRLMKTFSFAIPSEAGPVGIAPPTLLIQSLLKGSVDAAPPCSGLLVNPCVKPDGALMVTDGWDKETGLYVAVPGQLRGLHLPEAISQEMAAESLRWLREVLLDEWMFSDELGRDWAVAMFLTAVQRKMIADDSGSIAFLASAPIQSSGKTALMQLLNHVVFCRPVPAQSWAEDIDEMRKVLLAILLEGHPCVLFDNLPDGSDLDHPELAKALTNPLYGARILGVTKNGVAPTQVMWLFSGNNVRPATDFVTRIGPIYLDPKTERPEERQFVRLSLSDWAQEHRPEFFEHALRIIAGGIRAQAAGWTPTYPATRYKDLDAQVLRPLEWAGSVDLTKAFDANRAGDQKGNERAELLELWHAIYGEAFKKAREILKDVQSLRTFDGAIYPPPIWPGRQGADPEELDEEADAAAKEQWKAACDECLQLAEALGDAELVLMFSENRLANQGLAEWAVAAVRDQRLEHLGELLDEMMVRPSAKGLGRVLLRMENRRYGGLFVSRAMGEKIRVSRWQVKRG